MILYATTIFLSAFLLFQVQPLIAKIILPWFGGTAAVWTAAMLFFQISLLAGYAYAHFLIGRLDPKRQMQVHGALLLLSLGLLPILPNPMWKPEAAGDPTARILILLAVTIGLPYFLLSSTSPLLQAWYVRRTGSKVPYRLFALSNFGSMLGLISFPFFVEPNFTSGQQAWGWSGIYFVFVLLCGSTALVSNVKAASKEDGESNLEPVPVGGTTPLVATLEPDSTATRPPWRELVLWVSLAACASVLLVSITNHLSQNVAPIPLLWVIPLALYLFSFILCFESDKIYQRWIFVPALAPLLGYMAYYLYIDSGNTPINTIIPLFAAGLFVCCMVCHGELAKRKPAPQYLTLFYLMVALGGALGGIVVALVAPRLFHSYLELPLAMFACALLMVIALWDVQVPRLGLPADWTAWTLRIALCIGLGTLGGYLFRHQYDNEKGYRVIVRNFYGVLHVRDDDPDPYALRTLTHGTINHGSQLLAPDLAYITTSYYGETSGVGRAIRALREQGPVRIGSIGLGAGVLSNYGRAGDYIRIYEINPLVPGIAQGQFSFYPHSAADKKIIMGDARLSLERQEPQNFDILSVDAFSSDAIPIHLLTREALALYFKQLKPDGILALHISNRYLDLAPVCAAGADYFHKEARTVSDDGEGGSYLNSSTWVLVTSHPQWFDSLAFSGADITPTERKAGFRPWTDDYSNLVQIFKDLPDWLQTPLHLMHML
ncbi:MAG TPA: fused MFS/spermidine synthase [Bryobacteraceae bacterium]|jgi:hypothetical protein